MPIYIRDQGQLAQLSNPAYKGEDGEAGMVPNLQIGSITALPSDQQASVTIQGDKENPTINIGIPSGEIGDKGLYVGRPEDAYDETKVVFDDKNWIDDTYFENSTVDYVGGEHESLKEKSDSDVEYILRKLGTQHYEGSSITATNTYAMQVKSAVFKGQTLVNIVKSKSFGGNKSLYLYRFGAIKENEKITIFATNPNVKLVRVGLVRTSDGSWAGETTVSFPHTRKAVYTVPPGFVTDYIGVLVDKAGDSTGHEEDFVIFRGDQSHLNIMEYFEGMRSVKGPNLVSIGKNLFADSFEIGSITASGTFPFEKNRVRTVNYIKVKPSTTYKIKDFGEFITRFDLQYDKDKKVISEGDASNQEVRTVVTKANTEYIRFTLVKADNRDFTEEDLQLIKCMMVESKTNPTEYETYKSHTLTTLQDLELRSNGNIYDELDLITGKLTQRIGEDGGVLTQEVVKTIDLKNQKVYSYDGTTHYTASSLQGHPKPILSIDVPTNITSLLKHQQNTINQQRLILSEREEMQNILIDSTLSRYEQTLLTATHISEEEVPNYIQKLYEVAYKRGIRTKEGEL